MLNEKRVKHMIRLASYDKQSGESDLKINSYFKRDYVGFNVLASLFWTTVGYVSVLGILFMAYMESLLENITVSSLISIGSTVLIGYFVTIIVFGCFAIWFYGKKYKMARQNVKKYTKDLQILEKMYEREEG